MGAYSISDKKAINEALEEGTTTAAIEGAIWTMGTLSEEQQMCAIGRA